MEEKHLIVTAETNSVSENSPDSADGEYETSPSETVKNLASGVEAIFFRPVSELRLYETDDLIIVAVAIPGTELQDISLKASGISMTLQIRKNKNDQNKKIKDFQKKIHLPAVVNPDRTKAVYRNGILDIRFEKKCKKIK